jgi:hypothetical protein
MSRCTIAELGRIGKRWGNSQDYTQEAPMDMLQVHGNQIVDARGTPVRLRGTCVGGWMNMENSTEVSR